MFNVGDYGMMGGENLDFWMFGQGNVVMVTRTRKQERKCRNGLV